MSADEAPDPDLTAALNEAITLWATPGLVEDPDLPEVGALALLALVPSVVVQTRDDHPGAELIDVATSSLLRSGFGLLGRLEPAGLAALPILEDWHVELDPGGVLRIVEPTGTLYDGDLGPQPPAGWHDAVHRRGRLIVLFGSAVDIGAADRVDRLDQAAGAGGLVGAQLPLHITHHR